jgi:hypothetical protein
MFTILTETDLSDITEPFVSLGTGEEQTAVEDPGMASFYWQRV